MPDEYVGEWGVEQWRKAWTIRVGAAYACRVCGSMVMVTRGGVGTLEPACCRRQMEPVQPEAPETAP